MPLYEYSCRSHGEFEAMAAMSASGAPARCPSCQAESPRILSAVRGAQLPHSEVVARDRNEKSQHEPKRVVRERSAVANGERPGLQRSHGSRPWALEHS